MNNIIKPILVVLLVGWVVITFMFSEQEGSKSTVTSKGVIKTVINTIPSTKTLNDTDKQKLMEKLKKPIRKMAHFMLYLVGGILIYSVINLLSIDIALKVVFAQIMGTLFAILDEIHQLFVPGRSGQPFDVCIDSFGILTGILIVLTATIIYKNLSGKGVLVEKRR